MVPRDHVDCSPIQMEYASSLLLQFHHMGWEKKALCLYLFDYGTVFCTEIVLGWIFRGHIVRNVSQLSLTVACTKIPDISIKTSRTNELQWILRRE